MWNGRSGHGSCHSTIPSGHPVRPGTLLPDRDQHISSSSSSEGIACEYTCESNVCNVCTCTWVKKTLLVDNNGSTNVNTLLLVFY